MFGMGIFGIGRSKAEVMYDNVNAGLRRRAEDLATITRVKIHPSTKPELWCVEILEVLEKRIKDLEKSCSTKQT